MTKRVTVVAALLATPIAVLTACTSNQPSSHPQSPSPTGTTTGPPPGTERLSTQLKSANGTPVANATFDFANGYATVTVETVAGRILTPGFHGMHIHAVGKCEANSVAPTGGPPGDFLSAGGHYQAPGHTGQPASGNLPSLLVRSDGSAKLVTTTDAFTAADLRGADGAVLIIHQDPDNFANIPPRYTTNGTPGPDQETLATGDAGKRVACGVIAPASATTTSTPTETVTTTVTTVTPTVLPPATPTSPTSPTETTTTSTTTTVTTTSPTAPTTTFVPGNPVQPGYPPGPGPGGG
jgi:Cu-Zn family superoxide dismutase